MKRKVLAILMLMLFIGNIVFAQENFETMKDFINVSPIVNLKSKIGKYKKIDINIITEFSGSDLSNITNKLNKFKQENKETLDITFNVVNTLVSVGGKQTLDTSKITFDKMADENILIYISINNQNNYNMSLLNEEFLSNVVQANARVFTLCKSDILDYKVSNQYITLNQLMDSSVSESKHYATQNKTAAFNNLELLLNKLKEDLKSNSSSIGADLGKLKNIAVDVVTDYETTKLASLNSKLTSFKAEMLSKGFNINFNVMNNKKESPFVADINYNMHSTLDNKDITMKSLNMDMLSGNKVEYFQKPISLNGLNNIVELAYDRGIALDKDGFIYKLIKNKFEKVEGFKNIYLMNVFKGTIFAIDIENRIWMEGVDYLNILRETPLASVGIYDNVRLQCSNIQGIATNDLENNGEGEILKDYIKYEKKVIDGVTIFEKQIADVTHNLLIVSLDNSNKHRISSKGQRLGKNYYWYGSSKYGVDGAVHHIASSIKNIYFKVDIDNKPYKYIIEYNNGIIEDFSKREEETRAGSFETYLNYHKGALQIIQELDTNGFDGNSAEIISVELGIYKDRNGIWVKKYIGYSKYKMIRISNNTNSDYKYYTKINPTNSERDYYEIYVCDDVSATIRIVYGKMKELTFNTLPAEFKQPNERIVAIFRQFLFQNNGEGKKYKYIIQTPTKTITYVPTSTKEKVNVIENTSDCFYVDHGFYLTKKDGLYFKGKINYAKDSNSNFFESDKLIKIMDVKPKSITRLGYNGVLIYTNNKLFYMGGGNYSEYIYGTGLYTYYGFARACSSPELISDDVQDFKINKTEKNDLMLVKKSNGIYLAGTNPLSIYRAVGYMYTKANNSKIGLDLYENPNITNLTKIPNTEGFDIEHIDSSNLDFYLSKNGKVFVYGVNNYVPTTEITNKFHLNLSPNEIVTSIHAKESRDSYSISFIVNNKDNTKIKNMKPREIARSYETVSDSNYTYYKFQNQPIVVSAPIYAQYLKSLESYNLRYAYRNERADTYYMSYEMKHLRTLTSLTYKRAYELDFANMNFSNNQDSSNYTIFLSDGLGNDFNKSYGEYFPYMGLNNLIKTKLNSTCIYLITQQENIDYKFNSAQELTLRDLVTKSNNKIINSSDGLSNINAFFVDIRKTCDDYNKFLDGLNENRKTGYARVGDIITHTPEFSDYEKDSINLQKLKYSHNPNVFENNTGYINNNNQWFYADSLKDPLHTVGEYLISYKAQDNPSSSPNFDEYRKWSEESSIKLYLKRDPIARFKPNYSTSITFTNDSYSLDYYSQLNKGVANSYWKYKELFSNKWIVSDIIPSLDKTKKYIVSLVVKDTDGFISKPYSLLINSNYKNIPPVALFELKDYKMYVGDSNIVHDRSYDTDGYITNWKFEIINQKGKGNVFTSDTLRGVQNKLATLGIGKYQIALSVKDNGGLFSNKYFVDLEVYNKPVTTNNPPVARLSINPKKILVGQTAKLLTDYNDPDGDKIVEKQWGYNKEGVHGWIFSNTSKDATTLDQGYYQYSYRVKDEKGAWSPWVFDHVEILPHNTKPNAKFKFNKNKILEGQELKIIDESNPNDSWDVIVKHEWQVKKGAGNWRRITNDPQTQFAEYGKYYIRHRVLDLGNELSSGLWSDWVEKTIEVLPHNTKPIIEFKIPDSIFINDLFTYHITEDPNDNWDEIIERKWYYSQDGGATWTKVAAGPIRFDKSGAYLIKSKVKDRGNELSPGLWSDDYIRTINVVNKPNHQSIAQFTVTPNPQVENGKLTYNDTSYDPDTWDIITERKWTYYDLQTGQWSIEGSTPPTSFDKQGTYIIALKVRDKGNAHYPAMWSEYCYKTIEILPINHKPIADFSFTPEIQVINEPITFTDLSYDNDAWDKLTEWEWSYKKKKSNTWTVWSTTQIPNQLVLNTIGAYELRLKVKDKGNVLSPASWSNYTIKEINITDIDIKGQVHHTSKWNQNRINYNLKKTGTQDSPRGYEIFFPGEKFMLRGDTKGAVHRVTVELEGTRLKTNLRKIATNLWEGSLWESSMLKWSDKKVTLIFKAYGSSLVKEDRIDVWIIEDEYWRLHREF